MSVRVGIVLIGLALLASVSAPLGGTNIACRSMEDMVLLAHIREQHRLSLNSYGRPRMTEELKEIGLEVGHPTARQWFACKP